MNQAYILSIFIFMMMHDAFGSVQHSPNLRNRRMLDRVAKQDKSEINTNKKLIIGPYSKPSQKISVLRKAETYREQPADIDSAPKTNHIQEGIKDGIFLRERRNANPEKERRAWSQGDKTSGTDGVPFNGPYKRSSPNARSNNNAHQQQRHINKRTANRNRFPDYANKRVKHEQNYLSDKRENKRSFQPASQKMVVWSQERGFQKDQQQEVHRRNTDRKQRQTGQPGRVERERRSVGQQHHGHMEEENQKRNRRQPVDKIDGQGFTRRLIQREKRDTMMNENNDGTKRPSANKAMVNEKMHGQYRMPMPRERQQRAVFKEHPGSDILRRKRGNDAAGHPDSHINFKNPSRPQNFNKRSTNTEALFGNAGKTTRYRLLDKLAPKTSHGHENRDIHELHRERKDFQSNKGTEGGVRDSQKKSTLKKKKLELQNLENEAAEISEEIERLQNRIANLKAKKQNNNKNKNNRKEDIYISRNNHEAKRVLPVNKLPHERTSGVDKPLSKKLTNRLLDPKPAFQNQPNIEAPMEDKFAKINEMKKEHAKDMFKKFLEQKSKEAEAENKDSSNTQEDSEAGSVKEHYDYKKIDENREQEDSTRQDARDSQNLGIGFIAMEESDYQNPENLDEPFNVEYVDEIDIIGPIESLIQPINYIEDEEIEGNDIDSYKNLENTDPYESDNYRINLMLNIVDLDPSKDYLEENDPEDDPVFQIKLDTLKGGEAIDAVIGKLNSEDVDGESIQYYIDVLKSIQLDEEDIEEFMDILQDSGLDDESLQTISEMLMKRKQGYEDLEEDFEIIKRRQHQENIHGIEEQILDNEEDENSNEDEEEPEIMKIEVVEKATVNKNPDTIKVIEESTHGTAWFPGYAMEKESTDNTNEEETNKIQKEDTFAQGKAWSSGYGMEKEKTGKTNEVEAESVQKEDTFVQETAKSSGYDMEKEGTEAKINEKLSEQILQRQEAYRKQKQLKLQEIEDRRKKKQEEFRKQKQIELQKIEDRRLKKQMENKIQRIKQYEGDLLANSTLAPPCIYEQRRGAKNLCGCKFPDTCLRVYECTSPGCTFRHKCMTAANARHICKPNSCKENEICYLIEDGAEQLFPGCVVVTTALVKPGRCPSLRNPYGSSSSHNETASCHTDYECKGDKKCCQLKELDQKVCTDPVADIEKPGLCPPQEFLGLLSAHQACQKDVDCPQCLKCCKGVKMNRCYRPISRQEADRWKELY